MVKGVLSLPGVRSRHDEECMPSEQMENIPMVVMLPSDSRQKQFTKEKKRNEPYVCKQPIATSGKKRSPFHRLSGGFNLWM